MKKVVCFLGLYILMVSHATAYAVPVGITLLSENHHIEGEAGRNLREGEIYDSYSVSASTPIHMRVEGAVDDYGIGPVPVISEAWAGDFGVRAVAGAWFAGAEAESTYTFSLDNTNLILGAAGGGEAYERNESVIRITLVNLTLGTDLLDAFYGLPYEVPGTPDGYNWVLDMEYNFLVNPDHSYQLGLYAMSGYGDDARSSYLNVNLASVPEPSTFLLIGMGFCAMVGFRRKYRKNSL